MKYGVFEGQLSLPIELGVRIVVRKRPIDSPGLLLRQAQNGREPPGRGSRALALKMGQV